MWLLSIELIWLKSHGHKDEQGTWWCKANGREITLNKEVRKVWKRPTSTSTSFPPSDFDEKEIIFPNCSDCGNEAKPWPSREDAKEVHIFEDELEFVQEF